MRRRVSSSERRVGLATSASDCSGSPAHEVVVDCLPLQQAWAREHGQDGSDRESTLLAQVAEFEPDVVYLQNLHVLSDETMRALRGPGRLIAGQIASAARPSSACACTT